MLLTNRPRVVSFAMWPTVSHTLARLQWLDLRTLAMRPREAALLLILVAAASATNDSDDAALSAWLETVVALLAAHVAVATGLQLP